MKKILLASIAAAALVSGAEASSFNGFYAGVSVGLSQSKSKIGLKTAISTGANGISAGSLSAGTSAFSGTLFAGYGQTLANNIYLGGEIFGSLSAGSVTIVSVGTTSLTAKVAPSFGAAARLGYTVTPQSLVFLSLGVASEGVKASGSIAGTAASITKRKVAFVPGIGFEMLLADNLALRGDMTYSFAGKLDVSAIGGTTTAGDKSYEPRTLGVKLGLAYRF